MRCVAAILLGLVAGCGEPDFDTRYEKAEQDIRDKAAELDKELETRAKQGETVEPGKPDAEDSPGN